VYTGTGYILFDEFCCVVRKKMQDDEDEKELRDMFRILDKEKKGEVNTNELRYPQIPLLRHARACNAGRSLRRRRRFSSSMSGRNVRSSRHMLTLRESR